MVAYGRRSRVEAGGAGVKPAEQGGNRRSRVETGGAGVKPAELSNAKPMQCPVDGRMLDSGLPNHST